MYKTPGTPSKRPKLQIMGIEEGEKKQIKGIENIFNKIMAENLWYRRLSEHQTAKIRKKYP
jgi:hypothetical protein